MLISWDLETALIQPGNLQPKPVVSSWSFDSRPGSQLHLPDQAAKQLREWLPATDLHFVGQNVSYDFGVMMRYYPDLTPLIFQAYADGRIHDTMVLQKLIDIAAGCHNFPRSDGTRGYSLADLEQHYLGISRHDDKADPESWRFRYAELDGVPLDQWPAKATEYALADAVGTLAVYGAQKARYGEVAGEADSVRAAWALHLFSCYGVRTDPSAVLALEADLKSKRVAYQAALQAASFLKLVPLSAEDRRNGVEPACYIPGKKGPKPAKWSKDMATIKATVEAAYADLGLELPLTEKGAVSTDRDTCERVGSVSPALAALADASNVEKLLSTYIPLLKKGADVPLQPRYNVLVDSGRCSASEPNIQNQPRAPGVRECFVPAAGHAIVSTDYSTLELCALSQVCLNLFGRSKMAEAINEGRDLHLEVAAQILGITYEEAKARKGSPEVKEARQFAKIANFGLPGGLGITTLREFARTSYGTELTEAQAVKLKSTWLRAWPEMVSYFAHVSRLVGEGDATIKSFGNGMLRGGVTYTAAANHFMQNLAAQGAKDACFWVAYECYVDRGTALFGCRPWGMVHDQVLTDVPTEKVHDAGHRQAEILVERMRKVIPDVLIKADPVAMEVWLKKDDGLFVEGKLVPWPKPTSAHVAAP